MPYVGNKPEVGNFRKCDAITTSATATYNLLVGGVAVNPNQNQCIVSLNGVIQSSGNSYTIASSQITFASTLASSDVIDFILILGDTLDAGIPSDSSVGLAQLSATGTPSSSNFLRGDNSWQTVSGTTINNNADNKVITGSGTANTLEGETNFIYNGTIAGLGADGANADLGDGLHIKISDSGASASTGADALVIEESGNPGISLLSSTSGNGSIHFGDSGNNTIGRMVYRHASNSLAFETNTAEAMRIDTNGYLLMDKTTSDTAVVGTELHGAQIIVTRSDQYASFEARKNGADGQVLRFKRDASLVGEIEVTSSSTNYATSSDFRLKENKVAISDGIARLKTLKPYRFNFKITPDKTVDGFFAHEVTAVPEAITGTKDELEKNKDGTNKLDDDGKTIPKHQGIDQSKLVPLLTSALQEAITKIETLETKVTALENK